MSFSPNNVYFSEQTEELVIVALRGSAGTPASPEAGYIQS